MAGFNREAWNGTAPLVAPMPDTIEVGSVIWSKHPDGPDVNHDPIGGIVVARKVDADGEATYTVVRASKKSGQFRVTSHQLSASEVDGSIVEPVTDHRLHRAARQICRALGEQQGGFIAGFDRWLLETAVELVVTAEERRAADNAVRAEHEAERFTA